MGIPAVDFQGGSKLPIVGLGTSRRPHELEKVLDYALEIGYRHIDTAHIYGTEETIGKVLNKWISSGKIRREELFIVTKLPAAANSPEKVEEHLNTSLKRLQLTYVDLYLIHFPVCMEFEIPGDRYSGRIAYPTDHIALWKKMEEQVDAGRTKTIGLSNFNIPQISKILNIARIKPASLQVEIHIYLQNEELVKYAQDNGIVVVAHSPLGGTPDFGGYTERSGLPPAIREDPTVAKIAAKHNKTPGQILLKFLIQRNIVVIPKSYNPERLKQNIELFDFTLDDNDVGALQSLEVGEKARLAYTTPNFKSVSQHPEWPFPWTDDYYRKLPHNLDA